MRVRSKKTTLEFEITPQEWEQMKGRGDATKYVILSKDSARKPKPEEVKTTRKRKTVKPPAEVVDPPQDDSDKEDATLME